MEDQKLLDIARQAASFAYVPYSKFHVGAALLTIDNEVITGCNVENLSFGLAICAERTALVKAVSQGKTKFKAIAIWAGENGDVVPCGACRQFMSEFMGQDTKIILNRKEELTLESLFPFPLEIEL